MMLKLKHLALVGVFMAMAVPAIAQDIALIIGNRGYRYQDNVRDASKVRDSLFALEEAGFRVFIGQNLTQLEQMKLATDFTEALGGAERVVVLLRGHIVSNTTGAWLLGTDARNQNPYYVGGAGLSIGALLEAAASKPGAAIVMLGTGNTGAELGAWMTAGPGTLDVPQGVALVQGPVGRLSGLITNLVSTPGKSLHSALRNSSRDVVATGYLPQNLPFMSGRANDPGDGPVIRDGDRAYWEAVKAIGTIAALQTYLDRYPRGRYIYEAEEMIADLQANPERQAQADEERLNLNRENRRQIQRNLSILGFDPRGVDGVFGRGSRAAIAAWQRSRGIEGYGYLTGNQIAALQSAADIRSRELEDEAERRRIEQEREDAAYWRQTGRNGSERGLRAYLRRYPDGIYSEIAREQLEDFEEDRRDDVSKAEREFWDRVRANGSADAYRQYLRRYPRGAFVNAAKARIEQIEGDSRNAEVIRQAKAEEARVAGNSITRLLVEQKLQALGLKPGRVDGQFDESTRRAVRQFQRTRQISVTGYVTQQTIVRLLAAR